MADANIRAVITAKDEASPVISKFSGTSVAAFGAIAGAASALASRAIDVVSDSIGDAIKRVDTLNNSTRVFTNMGFQAADVATSMNALKQSILGLPTPLDSAVRGMQMIASTTPDINRAQGVFSALNDAIVGFGGSAEMVDGAVLQLSQAFSNGRIDAQTWNSMMQNGLGPTLNAIAKQMGMTTGQLKDGLSNGTISVGEFQDKLIELDKKGGGGLKSLQTIAHDATAGIGTGMENAKTALSRGMASIIESIGPERISGAISKVGEAFEQLLKVIGKFITFMEEHKLILYAALGALAGLVIAVVVPAFIAWATAAGAAAIATLAATWPILLIGAAIGAVAFLVITHWETIKNAFGTAINWIREKVEYMKNHFWETVGFVIGFFATLPIKIPFLIGEMIAKVIGLIANINWGNVWSGLWNFLSGLWGRIANGFRDLVNNIKNINWGDIGKSIANGVIGMIEGAINGALKGLPGAKSIHLPRFAAGVTNFAGGMAIVGERGPEIVQLPQGSNVIPNNKIGSAGGNINLSVNVGVYAGSEQEKRKVAKELFNALGDIASSKNMTVAELLA